MYFQPHMMSSYEVFAFRSKQAYRQSSTVICNVDYNTKFEASIGRDHKSAWYNFINNL